MDYIFLIGPSAVGKTTLAKALFEHYHGVYLEQNMVPEFAIPEDTEDEGIFEEQLCWDNVLLQLRFFHDKGYKNIVALDFDDLRTREIPMTFKGTDFITLKLTSSNPDQIKSQMEHRHTHEGGLYLPDNVARANHVIRTRPLLPNEVAIDVAGKTKEEVFREAVAIIDGFTPAREYDYTLPPEPWFLSWVQSRKLV